MIEVSLYFIQRLTARGRDTRHHRESSDYFEYPPKHLYLNQATLRILAQLSYQKKLPESTISNQKKFLRSSPSPKNGSTPPPPPLRRTFRSVFCSKILFSYYLTIVIFKEPKHQIKGRKLLDLKSSF